jgi:hypothetical protein
MQRLPNRFINYRATERPGATPRTFSDLRTHTSNFTPGSADVPAFTGMAPKHHPLQVGSMTAVCQINLRRLTTTARPAPANTNNAANAIIGVEFVPVVGKALGASGASAASSETD